MGLGIGLVERSAEGGGDAHPSPDLRAGLPSDPHGGDKALAAGGSASNLLM